MLTGLLKTAVYNGKEKNIMFTLTKNECEELAGIISKYYCPCDSKHGHCAEIECDVQFICEILWDHIERNDKKFDEGKSVIEGHSEEFGIDWDDELPFRK